MTPKEFALTLDSLWKQEIGKERLDQIMEFLLENLVTSEADE